MTWMMWRSVVVIVVVVAVVVAAAAAAAAAAVVVVAAVACVQWYCSYQQNMRVLNEVVKFNKCHSTLTSCLISYSCC